MSPSPNFYHWQGRSTKKPFQVGEKSSQLCTPNHQKSKDKRGKPNLNCFYSSSCSLNPNISTLLNKTRKNPIEWMAFRKGKTLHRKQHKSPFCRWKSWIIWARVVTTVVTNRLAIVILCLREVLKRLQRESSHFIPKLALELEAVKLCQHSAVSRLIICPLVPSCTLWHSYGTAVKKAPGQDVGIQGRKMGHRLVEMRTWSTALTTQINGPRMQYAC